MMMDWSNIWWNRLDKHSGEKHLFIVPNAEHMLVTGLVPIYSAMGTFTRSIATEKP